MISMELYGLVVTRFAVLDVQVRLYRLRYTLASSLFTNLGIALNSTAVQVPMLPVSNTGLLHEAICAINRKPTGRIVPRCGFNL